MPYLFFIDTRTYECPGCHKMVRPKGPFKTIHRNSDGETWKTGECPECGVVAVMP